VYSAAGWVEAHVERTSIGRAGKPATTWCRPHQAPCLWSWATRSPRDRLDGLTRSQHLATRSSIEDDALSDRLRVIWAVEPGASIREREHLPIPTNGFDHPATLDAFLDAVRWGAIPAADMHLRRCGGASAVCLRRHSCHRALYP
jgi:hypothetical protein